MLYLVYSTLLADIVVSMMNRKNAFEVEIQAEQEKIRTYARQQMDTKDNVQYKALGRQQETCKETISERSETDKGSQVNIRQHEGGTSTPICSLRFLRRCSDNSLIIR